MEIDDILLFCFIIKIIRMCMFGWVKYIVVVWYWVLRYVVDMGKWVLNEWDNINIVCGKNRVLGSI